ncbi:hypothetical protein Htur_4894 (plasmid) [Haloterrigena turkmenica DSM 5511]|uniref:Uncharacterized protein n=1 Tax=Haloterrigena turkmenica (strain ATCC 51198 / DSM 5511 / JCM 9101 / NCIMB 13204 / VKM B-1734 / 4k) TaxID=543526 RepID=D2S2P3_HALTV|nr:hypothetical protein Htur_4894 [Haloterrigena turkmenica DSM 5511]
MSYRDFLKGNEIVHADTGETLAMVEWNDDRVEIHEDQ